MPHYLNLNIVLRDDFIVTRLAIMFFIYWVLANFGSRDSGMFSADSGKAETDSLVPEGCG